MRILACPHCGVSLVLRDETTEKDEIVTGSLECSQCAASFDIRDGVPCMLQDSESANRTRQGFTEQWQLRQMGKFEKESLYGQDPHKRAEKEIR